MLFPFSSGSYPVVPRGFLYFDCHGFSSSTSASETMCYVDTDIVAASMNAFVIPLSFHHP